MNTRIKICGVTTLDNALMCAEAGADLLGLNFYPLSPRCLAPEAARALAEGLHAALGERCPLLVGVFVNMSIHEITHLMQIVGLDAAQLSGDESSDMLGDLAGRGIKAIRPRSRAEALDQTALFLPDAPDDPRLPSLVVDAYHKDLYGGTGEQASLDVASAAKGLTPRLMLAGGLGPKNVAERVQAVRPWGIDVASGVEKGQPGIKDPALIRALIQAVRACDRD